MFSIINVMKKQTLLYRLRTYDIKKKGPDLNLAPSPLFVATPLLLLRLTFM